MINLQELEIYGNHFSFEQLYYWIDDKVNNTSINMSPDCCITITGPPGIGKTYSVEKICNSLDIHIKKIDSTNCKSITEMTDLFSKMASTNLEEILLEKTRKNILFIDEFEVLTQFDRNIPSVLYNMIDTSKSCKRSLPYIPVVIACNDNAEKRLGDIRRFCKNIHLKSPTDADLLLMLRSYTQKENIVLPMAELLSISENVCGNMQHALQMLNYHILNEQTTSHTDASIDTMPNINILYKNPTYKTAYHVLSEDAWMNPLRFHENLANEIQLRKGTHKKKNTVYSDILRCMLDWDILTNIENDIDIAMTYLCSAPCYILPKLQRKKNSEEPSMKDFTKTLSQMSLQSKMKRNTFKNEFPWEHIGNYFYKKQKNKKFSDLDTDIQPYGSG